MGRDNKAAFDACVARGKTLFKQLVKHPDVREAIAWAEGEQKKRLNITVDIQDTGPCRKRIRVAVPPEDISDHFNEQFTELVRRP